MLSTYNHTVNSIPFFVLWLAKLISPCSLCCCVLDYLRCEKSFDDPWMLWRFAEVDYSPSQKSVTALLHCSAVEPNWAYGVWGYKDWMAKWKL